MMFKDDIHCWTLFLDEWHLLWPMDIDDMMMSKNDVEKHGRTHRININIYQPWCDDIYHIFWMIYHLIISSHMMNWWFLPSIHHPSGHPPSLWPPGCRVAMSWCHASGPKICGLNHSDMSWTYWHTIEIYMIYMFRNDRWFYMNIDFQINDTAFPYISMYCHRFSMVFAFLHSKKKQRFLEALPAVEDPCVYDFESFNCSSSSA